MPNTGQIDPPNDKAKIRFTKSFTARGTISIIFCVLQNYIPLCGTS